MAASIVLFAVLARHIVRRGRARRDPLIEPSVFAHRGYSAGALVLLFYFGGMLGAMLGITLFLQIGEGFSAVHAGLTTAPFALGTAVTAPVAANLMAKSGGRVLIQAGTAVSLVGYVGLALILGNTDHLSTWGMAGPLLVVGLGMGLFLVPAFDTIIAAVTPAELGSASGTLNAIQQLGGALGIAVLGSVFFAALPHLGFAGSLHRTLWWTAGSVLLVLILSSLLPARAGAGGVEAALVGG
jgi:MFS family permease